MIEFIKGGDLFESGCDGLVNPVNTEGIMGGGLAAEFKKRWPAMFVNYQQACRTGALTIGTVMPYKVAEDGGDLWILNFPTKDRWRDPSKLGYVEKGLADLRRAIRSLELKSVAIPALGCGLGILDWPMVRAKLFTKLPGCATDRRVPGAWFPPKRATLSRTRAPRPVEEDDCVVILVTVDGAEGCPHVKVVKLVWQPVPTWPLTLRSRGFFGNGLQRPKAALSRSSWRPASSETR